MNTNIKFQYVFGALAYGWYAMFYKDSRIIWQEQSLQGIQLGSTHKSENTGVDAVFLTTL